MPTGEERRLKLIKGLSTGGQGRPTRTVTRRTVTRRRIQEQQMVEEMLRRLDEEPVERSVQRPVQSVGDPAGQPAEQPPIRPDEPVAALATGRAALDVAPAAGRAELDVAPAAGWAEPDATLAAPAPESVAAAAPEAAQAPAPDAAQAGADTGAREGTPAGGAVAGSAGRTRRVRLRRPAPVTVALTVALCLALVAAGFTGQRWYQDRMLEQARQHALAAAKQTTVNFISISASSVDRDLGRIVAGATGEFKEQFTRGQDQVRAAVVENKVESQGSVLRAGLLSGDRTTAVALVAVDATVKNVHAPQGRDSHYRIQVDLTRDRDSGTWLVSRLQFVG